MAAALKPCPDAIRGQPQFGGAGSRSSRWWVSPLLGLRGAVESLPFKLGAQVNHAKFGDGVVTGYEGSGAHTVVMVHFTDEGTKRLVVAYANLSAA